MIKNNVGKKIKLMMVEEGLTQKDLAKLLNVKQTMISQWVTGKSNATLRTLNKIAKAINKPLEYFLENYQEVKGHSNNVTQTGNIVVSHAEIESLKKDSELSKKDNELLKKDNELLEKEIENLKLKNELLEKNLEIEQLKKDREDKKK
jgi:transcriptional regulator with XRE-family HTH domain